MSEREKVLEIARLRAERTPDSWCWSSDEHVLFARAILAAEQENEALRKVLKAKDDLLIAYRLGSQTQADRALTAIAKAETILTGPSSENV